MDLLISIFNFITTESERPTNYSPYHLMWVGIVLTVTVCLICFCKNMSDKNVRRVTAILWISMAVLELMKQLIFGLSVKDGAFVWDYAWYAFPFQFCASPIYILPIAAFAKDGKLRDAAITFITTFSVFAGICVYVFPNDVFMHYSFINAQAMYHHGVQVFWGIYLAFRYREKMHFNNLMKGALVFSALVGIAMIMNIAVYHYFTLAGMDDTFNMFFISPFFDCTLPVLSIVYDTLPYPLFLCIYILGFMLCAGLVMLLMKGLVKLIRYDKEDVSE